MSAKNTVKHTFTDKQLAFQELFVGTLIYAVVLALFNDYTTVVDAKSFSTILYASMVLEILTFFTFMLKRKVLAVVGARKGFGPKLIRFFCAWLIMFVSKFVFVGALSLIFGEYIGISGFFGILLVVVSVTIVHRLALAFFKRLGE